MAFKFQLTNKNYLAGKSKTTGNYAIWEQRATGYVKVYDCLNLQELKNRITHLKHLAAKRELRTCIADLCGTSYAAARRDMGI